MKMPAKENPAIIKRWLKSQGAFVINLHGSHYIVGLPDLIACYRGRFIAVEVKAPGKRPRLLQLAMLSKIKQAGGIAIVATNVTDVQGVLMGVID